ncbi:hypothetical protein [Pararhizobium sp. A13]|uniref:hypothetical protein n=1 Tax=Pararhizobium sp. A13 TaxID=3133975 RepID=UPI00311B1711
MNSTRARFSAARRWSCNGMALPSASQRHRDQGNRAAGTFRFDAEFEWAAKLIAERRINVRPILTAQIPMERPSRPSTSQVTARNR